MPPPTSAAAATAPLMLFARQSIGQDANNVKTTFSSWDNCMTESYCKYPVIIAIVIASLIALSVIFCVVRCCCCGLECCCGICACFNACCPSPRGKSRSKYRDPEGPPPFKPSPYQGYQSTPAPFYNSQPQYAHFETGRGHSGGEDSLPAMPSWDNATSRRIEDHSAPEEMELGKIDLDHEQKAPMLANQAPAPHGGQGGFGNYSDSLPYQHQIASNGGDLGVASYGQQPPTYRGAQTTAPALAGGAAIAGAGAAAGGRHTPNTGYNYERPPLEPGNNSYGSQPSSGYTGPSAQSHDLHGASPSPPQQAYGGAAYQQSASSLPSALSAGSGQQQGYHAYQPARKPVEGSWRDV